MRSIKAIHDSFWNKDDSFRNEAEMFRNIVCTGISRNNTHLVSVSEQLGVSERLTVSE
jgi:hypothetical protein